MRGLRPLLSSFATAIWFVTGLGVQAQPADPIIFAPNGNPTGDSRQWSPFYGWGWYKVDLAPTAATSRMPFSDQFPSQEVINQSIMNQPGASPWRATGDLFIQGQGN